MLANNQIEIKKDSLIIKNRKEIVVIKEWGDSTVRIIVSPNHNIENLNNSGIVELNKNRTAKLNISKKEKYIEINNNNLKIIYDGEILKFYNKDKLVLKEYIRKQSNVRRTIGIDDHIPIEDLPTSSLNIYPHEFIYKSDNSYSTTLRFESDQEEKIYGLGGYQEKCLNKNLGYYELMQRNSQTSIPFYLSNYNYGFIWNNSSIGEVVFGKNQKIWKSNNSEYIDYIVTVGNTPKELITNLTRMIGNPPKINKNLLGLWQSKLRYQTIDEIKEVYKEYNKRNIKLSVIVIDYFHWTADGDFEFDMNYWCGIEEFAELLSRNGTKLMVSLWPTVNKNSKFYNYYQNNQMILKNINYKDNMFGESEILDFFNPKTRDHFKKLLKENYTNKNISLFWADQAEPEMSIYNHKEYLTYKGNLEKYGNMYPYYYIKAINGIDNSNSKVKSPTLVRSAWFNSQKYGSLVWSGDIESSFDSLKKQIQISISMGISGISWWTSDIGGFHSGNVESSKFKKLLIRWFQFATFSPILRMHGDRQPHTQRIGNSGGGVRTSGGPNEIWSFGSKVEKILTRYTKIRENLKEYILDLFDESHNNGYPLIRAMFLEFPEDANSWEETTDYMFGSDLLIVPITEEYVNKVEVYLPLGEDWINVWNGKKYKGGKKYEIEVTIDDLPVFCRSGSKIEKQIEKIFIKE